MKYISLLITMLVLISCSRLKMVKQVEGEEIPEGLTLTQIAEGIKAGGAVKGWIISKASDKENTMVGKVFVRNHSATVEIPYTQKTYKIVYKDSENLHYDPAKRVIHRNYLKWVSKLKTSIDSELLRQQASGK